MKACCGSAVANAKQPSSTGRKQRHRVCGCTTGSSDKCILRVSRVHIAFLHLVLFFLIVFFVAVVFEVCWEKRRRLLIFNI